MFKSLFLIMFMSFPIIYYINIHIECVDTCMYICTHISVYKYP